MKWMSNSIAPNVRQLDAVGDFETQILIKQLK